MYTWGQLKADVRARVFPFGEADNLVAPHSNIMVDAIMDLQKWVVCLQQDNTTIVKACESLYQCGMTIVDAPRGRITKVSVIDKINPDSHLEDPDAEDDWCSEVPYTNVDFCHVHRYRDTSRRSRVLYPIGAFFGLPFMGFRPGWPVPTDADLPAGLSPLDLGLHYSQASTDRDIGRAGSGIWAQDRGKIYLAPWLQTTETVIIKWDGLKRTWNDADPIDPDPMLARAIEEYLRWKHAERYDRDTAVAEIAMGEFNSARQDLIHECREETRVRNCEPSNARQASTQGSQTNALFYNDEQSASATCPDGTTGNPVSITITAGTVGSNISVADANVKALQMAQQQATASLDCITPPPTYWNTEQTVTVSCQGAPGAPAPTGTPATATVPANTVSSTVSQADADSLAKSQATALATSKLSCVYYNAEQTYTASCPDGSTGVSQTATVAAGTYSSTLSQADANTKALTDAKNQVAALLQANCVGAGTLYYNTPQTATATAYSNACPGPLGPRPGLVTVTVTVPANAVATTGDQMAANSQAQLIAQQFAQQVAASRAAANQCGPYSTTYPNP